MALYGGLDHTKHFAEFGEPLDSQEGVISPSARKALALAALGVTATAAEINASVDGQLATAAEVNRVADVSTRIVTLVATGAVDEATHEGKTLLLGEVGGDAAVTITLPAATGGGAKYKFKVSVLNTSGYVITHAGTDVFKGSVNIL